MTQNNGTPLFQEVNSKLTAREMFLAANAMLEMKEWIDHDKPTQYQLATKLSEKLGFKVTTGNVKGLIKMVGMDWKPNRAKMGKPNHIRNNGLRTVSRSLIKLFRKLGEEVPTELDYLLKVLDGKASGIIVPGAETIVNNPRTSLIDH